MTKRTPNRYRNYPALAIVAGVLATAVACGSAPEEAAPPAEPAPAPAAMPEPTPDRTVAIVGTEDLKFSVTTIEAQPGETIRIQLTVEGSMPKIAMAHNWVLMPMGTSDADLTAFAERAVTAGPASDYMPADAADAAVAHTGLAGAGETVEVTFTVPSEAGEYPFLCTFPGHFAAGMRGTLVVG